MFTTARTSPVSRPAAYLPAFVSRVLKVCLIALLAGALPACKVVVTVPFGGTVVTEDGFECREGDTCVVEVSDDTFDSTFKAVPAQGYTFTRWRRKPSAFCADSADPCYLSTTGFGGNSALMDFLATDHAFYLEPVFVRFNPTYWQTVLTQIEDGTFATSAFLYDINPDVANCNPGSLTNAAKARALQALNQTRAIHRLPAVARDDFYDMQVQEASLVQRANSYLNHNPASGDACYTSGAKEGASTSNLHGGSGGKSSDPASDIFGWANDNNNIAALMEAGHRRWVLYPELGYMSYGQVEGYSALKVFGFGMAPPNPVASDLEFVAMPYEGYPYALVSGGSSPTPWSISMVPQDGVSGDFDYFQNATVTVTDYASGKNLAVQNLHRDNLRFGIANFLSWLVAGWEYDRVYKVRINGIRMPGGGTRNLEYHVMIDRFDLFNVDYPLEASDMAQGGTFQGRFDTATDKDSYRISLGGEKTVLGQSEFSNQAFFILVYDAGKRLVKSSDSGFTQTFAQGKYTVIASRCDESGLCYQGTQTYRITIN